MAGTTRQVTRRSVTPRRVERSAAARPRRAKGAAAPGRSGKGPGRKVALIAAVAALAVVVAGTLAYFKDSDSVTNTFTVGQVSIELNESVPAGQTAKMTPGTYIDKDPKITVKSGSLDCWVFVKVEPSDNYDKFMDYSIAEGWTKGDGTDIPDSVYYRSQAAVSADADLPILANDRVRVRDTVTEQDLAELTEDTYPTLKFTGYAIQKAGIGSAKEAWKQLGA